MLKDMLNKLFLTAKAEGGHSFASSSKRDPYAAYNYRVEIVGKYGFARAGFKTVSGVGAENAIIEYRDGDDRQLSVRKMPGLITTNDVTLTRGMSEDMDMWNWIVETANAEEDDYKMTVIIELLGRDRKGVMAWELGNAWVQSYSAGELDATSNEVAVEEMVITYETIKRVTGTTEGSNTPTLM